VEVDVCAQTQPESGGRRKQGRREVQRHALEVVAQHPREARVDPRHQGERRQEVLAELPVRHPRLAFGDALEREVVDENRRDAPKLDVVGRRVAQREPGVDGGELDVQRQEGGCFQLTERPLVRPRDEVQRLRPQHGDGSIRIARLLDGCRLPRQEPPARHQLGRKRRLGECVPFLGSAFVHLPQENAVPPVDEPPGITPRRKVAAVPVHERGRVFSEDSVRFSSGRSFFFERKTLEIRRRTM